MNNALFKQLYDADLNDRESLTKKAVQLVETELEGRKCKIVSVIDHLFGGLLIKVQYECESDEDDDQELSPENLAVPKREVAKPVPPTAPLPEPELSADHEDEICWLFFYRKGVYGFDDSEDILAFVATQPLDEQLKKTFAESVKTLREESKLDSLRHHISAQRWELGAMSLGIISTGVSVVATVFSSLGSYGIAVTVLSGFAALLTGLVTVMRPQERGEQHKQAFAELKVIEASSQLLEMSAMALGEWDHSVLANHGELVKQQAKSLGKAPTL